MSLNSLILVVPVNILESFPIVEYFIRNLKIVALQTNDYVKSWLSHWLVDPLTFRKCFKENEVGRIYLTRTHSRTSNLNIGNKMTHSDDLNDIENTKQTFYWAWIFCNIWVSKIQRRSCWIWFWQKKISPFRKFYFRSNVRKRPE